MRVAWFTPFSTRSAIGEFSRHVTAALAARAEVDIWTADAEPWHPSGLRVLGFAAADDLADRLRHYDILIHSIGNHPGNHAAINAVSQRHPGIVILHDRVLHHMFAALWKLDAGTFDSVYEARMAAQHGAAGAAIARETVAGARRPLWEAGDEVASYPLDEEALRRALGVVTHSHGHATRLRGSWFGPVTALHHPCYRNLLACSGAPPPPRSDGRVQVTTIGHIIPFKNVDRVIGMLAADPVLAERVHYSVAGPIAEGYEDSLGQLLSASPHVSAELLGWREEEELDELMRATEIFVNLRHPVTESGSGSLARQLAFGRAVLCFDAGAFGELPGEALARVASADFDAAAVELERLVADPARRRRLGAAARGVAQELSEERYARELLAFVAEVHAAEPELRLIDRVAAELGTIRADPGLPVYETLAAELRQLLRP